MGIENRGKNAGESAKEMSERIEGGIEKASETGGGNSLPSDFDDKLDNLKFMRDRGVGAYFETIDQIKQMAQGEDPDGLKKLYYKGWEDGAFLALLKQLGEEVEE